MNRPLCAALLAAAAASLVAIGGPAAAEGPCVTQYVPRRGEVTVCTTTAQGCRLYLDPGGRTVALCVMSPVDTGPFAGCTRPDPAGRQVCWLTDECTVFLTTGRPPRLCL